MFGGACRPHSQRTPHTGNHKTCNQQRKPDDLVWVTSSKGPSVRTSHSHWGYIIGDLSLQKLTGGTTLRGPLSGDLVLGTSQ